MNILVESKLWTNKYFAALMAVLACILWGSAFPVLKVTYAELQIAPDDISARMLIAGARFLLAGLMVFAAQRFLMGEGVGCPGIGCLPCFYWGWPKLDCNTSFSITEWR